MPMPLAVCAFRLLCSAAAVAPDDGAAAVDRRVTVDFAAERCDVVVGPPTGNRSFTGSTAGTALCGCCCESVSTVLPEVDTSTGV